jgi:hypothetical protein
MPGLICEGDCKKAKNQKTKQGEVCETRIKEKRMDGWMDGGERALRIELGIERDCNITSVCVCVVEIYTTTVTWSSLSRRNEFGSSTYTISSRTMLFDFVVRWIYSSIRCADEI